MGAARHRATHRASRFAALVERLSEEGGDFDTDNLISNERSYLEVIPALKAAGVSGGAYIGVGPDQNFSYIAQLRPSIAFIVDIRRDNLLLHLLFKSLFALSRNRVEYLGAADRAAGRRIVSTRGATRASNGSSAYIDGARPDGADALQRLDRRRARRDRRRSACRCPPADFATIQRFHHTLRQRRPVAEVREPRPPPAGASIRRYRDLMLATDRAGTILELPGRRSPISSS